MFKTRKEIEVFINRLEGFLNTAINYKADPDHYSATELNKQRDNLEGFLQDLCGLTEEMPDPTEDYLCPDCGSPMKERTNRQNGNKFYGCTKYPDCRGTRDENGLSRQEREERKYKTEVTHQEGFSFNKKRNPVTEVSPQWSKGEGPSS